ncbi:hypothetical protein HMPREF9586_02133 [Cutibacterium acnes HL083PA2]|nr:hypothetical protein HMPREF9586_02133 [Cutibacterium acnes HL083PA2]
MRPNPRYLRYASFRVQIIARAMERGAVAVVRKASTSSTEKSFETTAKPGSATASTSTPTGCGLVAQTIHFPSCDKLNLGPSRFASSGFPKAFFDTSDCTGTL